ncbi:MAG TPA: hypothetical protein VJ692_16205 [Nitrospiraceae bacterium]|nr:hypothetical protein [Nitrospiraceae bacterium]
MHTVTSQSDSLSAIDQCLLEALQSAGPQTLEGLCAQAGLTWAQGFLAIDRLSRTGAVLLQQARRCEYRVSIKKAAA